VLARWGRVHWLGRALLLGSLILPMLRDQHVSWQYAGLAMASIALLLTCGRVTQELRRMVDRARYDADHDGLTGALSRAAFRARLDRIAARAGEDDGGALLLLDLDNFGAVNKTRGHAAGDAVLASVASRIGAAIGEDGFVGRLGGDEFGVVVRSGDPGTLARRMLAELRIDTEDKPGLAASMGMALIPRDGQDADSLMRAVDVALRVAKRTGRHELSVYAGEPVFDQGFAGARQALEALIRGEGLSMVVQPIVNMSDRRPHAYEALARFKAGATSNPLHWFALADEFGLRDELELACLRAALGLLAERPSGTLLSVNLSGPLLLDSRTRELLDHLPTLDGLIVELTENSLIEDTPGLHAVISQLLETGLRFAVDDMGAGCSGLRQITTLRPSYLKLDRSLVSGIDTDSDPRGFGVGASRVCPSDRRPARRRGGRDGG